MKTLFSLLFALLVIPGGAIAQDLCAGLPTDKVVHPRTADQVRPDVGDLYTDPDLGGKFRRITNIAPAGTGANPFIKPVYSPVPAWNADESYFFLYQSSTGASAEGSNGWRLYNGTTYAYIKNLTVTPSDVEQVWWDGDDPAKLYYPTTSARLLIQLDVNTLIKTTVHDFSTPPSSCSASETLYGESHHGTSIDTRRMTFACGNKRILYDRPSDTVIGVMAWPTGDRLTTSQSGRYTFITETDEDFRVYDNSLNYLRSLDIYQRSHSTFTWTADGSEYLAMAAYDTGPLGSGSGSMVLHDLSDASSTVIMGPTNGYPYPPSGVHLSGTAHQRAGWVWTSQIGGCPSSTYCPAVEGIGTAYEGLYPPQLPKGQDVLDNEITISNLATGTTCRVVHHHSTGKLNTQLTQPYWTEPHVTSSPTGTRALFASDWENTNLVNTYVIELPSYVPGGNPIIRQSYVPNGIQTVAYSQQMTAINGGAKTWEVSSGTLPTGLTLAGDGLLSGTPTTQGTFAFTIKVTEATNSYIAERPYVVDILEAPDLTITPTNLPNATRNAAYQVQFEAVNGVAPYAWDVSAGTLCSGLTLSAGGLLSGTPTTAETCNFTVRATDDEDTAGTQAVSLTVGAVVLPLTFAVNPGATSVVFILSGYGLESDTACSIETRTTLGELNPVATTVSNSGVRPRKITEVLAEGSYIAQAECPGLAQPSPISFALRSIGDGGYTYTLTPYASLVAQGVAKVSVEYNVVGEAPTTETASCVTGCTLTLPLASGSLYEIRHIWKTSGDAVVATSKVGTVAVP